MATAPVVADRMAVAGQRIPMSYEAWRAWEVEGVKSEWVDGEAVVFMPTTGRHWDLLSFLTTLLTAYVRFRRLGIVLGESVEMRIAGRGRLPDILFIKEEHRDRLGETRLEGPADLVVELVSADSIARDHEEKKAEYAAAGVAEYWLVDARPGEQGAAFYRLLDGAYAPIPLDAEDRLWSTVVDGFWLKPAWLARDPLPMAWPLVAVIEPEIMNALLGRGQAD